jgi:glucose/arabinose dehydrogenase
MIELHRMTISRAFLLPAAVFLVATTGCSAATSAGEDRSPSQAVTITSPAPSPTTARTCLATPGRVTELATGLHMPWGLTFLPDGSALISGRTSHQIHHIAPRGGRPTLVGTVPGVADSAEGGLLGLATSPRFERDRLVYAYLSANPTNRVVALRIGDDLRSLLLERVILDGIGTGNRHHGGRIAFGPDGHLWIGTGDAFDGDNAPNRDSLNGKVLRIQPDGSIPPDNPFGTAVYSIGHRNVQGLAFGPNRTVYAAELGLDSWDELNLIRRGEDYGWPSAEGPDGEGGQRPIFAILPAEASPSGIAYARGAIWISGLRGQRLWRLPVGNDGQRTGDPVAFLTEEYGRLRTIQVAPDGALWVTTSTTDRTTLGGVAPTNGDDRILRIELV